MSHQTIFFVFFSFIVFTCKSSKSVEPITVPSPDAVPSIVYFLDSIEASKAIIDDKNEGFFDRISVLDMELQMHHNFTNQARSEILTQYKQFLKTEVLNWTKEEKYQLYQVFDSVRTLSHALNPRLYPDRLSLVKIRTNHYGDDVYYTRGNVIFIPENIFKRQSQPTLLPVMVHELFHVVSRGNPNLRKKLYGLIGFEPIPHFPNLCPVLQKQILSNPDGMDMQYAITLSDSIQAIPIIFSETGKYNPGKKKYFDYLRFDLFRVRLGNDGEYVECDQNGKTTIPLSATPDFFQKIKDNTRYIIHPDEILADNFKIILLRKDDKDKENYSEQGNELLNQITTVLKNW